MKVKISQNQLSRFLSKFIKKGGEESDPHFFIKMIKFLKIIGQDEEIGKYILNKIKNGEVTNYNFTGDKVIGASYNFSINSFPLVLNAQRIFFNRGGRDYDFELLSPIFGDDDKLDLSFSLLNKIHKELFNYR
jgi:hypothetical protein